MRLLRLKLLSKFRGLQPGSEFLFDDAELQEGKLEPICLVGLNGSGKSNLLEVICEMFFYLDDYVLSDGKPQKKFKTGFGFEIEYLLNYNLELNRTTNLKRIKKLDWEGVREGKITIVKERNEIPRITLVSNGNMQVENSSDPEIFLLPSHVIAYSSGQNELLSNPFIKSGYRYFDLFERKSAQDVNIELGLNRLFYMDYESSQLALICNYLFAEENKVELITNELELDDTRPIDSFDIIIRLKNYRGNRIKLPLALSQSIEKLKNCATIVDEVFDTKISQTEPASVEIHLSFYYDEQMRRAFQRQFGSAILLFRDLYWLNLLNIHMHPVDTRKRIREAPSNTYDSLAYLLPVPARNRLIFSVDRLRLNKKTSGEQIKYKNLSDGEHQMMHVLGSIILLNTSGSILLFDEPETHFNPEWRSQLITLINKATQERQRVDKMRKQEIIITSHSPFIVSDCRRERVYIFEKGKVSHPKINTFGTSVSILAEEVFRKKESISGQSLEKIEQIKSKSWDTPYQIEMAKMAARFLGESVEKVLLFREILMRENEVLEDDSEL